MMLPLRNKFRAGFCNQTSGNELYRHEFCITIYLNILILMLTSFKIRNMKIKINWKKELRDWGFMILTILILYMTGLYTEVAGFAQRMVLATRVFSAEVNVADTDKKPADYDFTLLTLEGEKFDFRELKGKVVFMNFWASWCSPCVAEMPNIQYLYNSYKDRSNMVFVMISLDRDPEKARKFIKRKDFSFPIFTPDYTSGIPGIYESSSIPTTFVLNKEGFIDTKKIGMANYDTNEFRKYLDKLLIQ